MTNLVRLARKAGRNVGTRSYHDANPGQSCWRSVFVSLHRPPADVAESASSGIGGVSQIQGRKSPAERLGQITTWTAAGHFTAAEPEVWSAKTIVSGP